MWEEVNFYLFIALSHKNIAVCYRRFCQLWKYFKQLSSSSNTHLPGLGSLISQLTPAHRHSIAKYQDTAPTPKGRVRPLQFAIAVWQYRRERSYSCICQDNQNLLRIFPGLGNWLNTQTSHSIEGEKNTGQVNVELCVGLQTALSSVEKKIQIVWQK